MCATLLALSLASAPCLAMEPAVFAPALREERPIQPIVERNDGLPAQPSSRLLSNPELARVRGGFGLIAQRGTDGTVRLVQDGNMRDAAMPLAATWQQMDAWWNEVGGAYIAASLSRP